jgi:uncharacterized protein YjiK
MVRTLHPSEWGVPHPAGIAYVEGGSHFLLANHLDIEPQATTELVAVTAFEDFVANVVLDVVPRDAVNMAVDPHAHSLYLLDGERGRLAQVELDDDGLPSPDALVWHDLAALRLNDVHGMAIGPGGHTLYLLEGGTSTVLRVRLGEHAGTEPDELSPLSLAFLRARDLRGLAVHPGSGHLFVLSQARQALYELSSSGRLLATHSTARLKLRHAEGITLAPSADLTDPSGVVHLFIADSNLPSPAPSARGTVRTLTSPYGTIIEAALEPLEGDPMHGGQNPR